MVTTEPVPHIVPGTMLAIKEADYCYGQGLLALRVTRVAKIPPGVRLEWLRLVGEQIRHDGAVIKERDVLVRVSALAGGIRPAGWLPPQFE